MSVEVSSENQIVVQRVLQQILRLDLPREILDQSVVLAKEQTDIKAKPNKVATLLLKSSALSFDKSPFLKFLFSRLEVSRRALFKASKAEQPGLNSVLSEVSRTIRVIFTDADRNVELRRIIFEALTDSLLMI